MVDAEEQLPLLPLPLGIAFAGRKAQYFEKVAF
jgi:hypothetical protein